ncbi:hypothetical protein G6F50_016806 [Rhizopus delemar]|uniref:Uncharacterized protein n=1 Tax=Rhizopus delemar TaxID=936053 RepID=A0A9P7C173_9FUNG|nr:hypothetical protein G6F50_016806 [Rhizopus delemar]
MSFRPARGAALGRSLHVRIPADVGEAITAAVRPCRERDLVRRHRLPHGHERCPVLRDADDGRHVRARHTCNRALRRHCAGRRRQLPAGRQRAGGEADSRRGA